MRRLQLSLISGLILVLATAGTALAWATPQLATDCMPDEETYAWWITLPGVEDNYNFDWSFNSNFSGATTVDAGGTAPFYFTTPLPDTDPPHTLYVRWSSDHSAKTSMAANTKLCEEPPPDAPDLEFADCEESGESGWIKVSGLEEDVFVQVNGPTVLTINADGTFPLAPGHYGYRAVFDGEALDSGTFDIGECPEPGIEIVKTNDSGEDGSVEEGDLVTYTYRITNNGDTPLNVLDIEDLIDNEPLTDAEPGEEPAVDACEDFERLDDDPGNDNDLLEAGETWVLTCAVELEETTSNEVCVYADVAENNHAELIVTDQTEPDVWACDHNRVLVVEGGTGGETGTPPQGGSIPDTATSIPSQSSPLATMVFGLLLVGSLGALAYANVRSGRR